MKNLILILTAMFVVSCSETMIDTQISTNENIELDLRGPCVILDVGDNVCSVFPQCQMPGGWVPKNDRQYFDLCLDILNNQPGMKVDGNVITMTLGGATCPYANLCAPFCEYYGVSTVSNPHTLASRVPVVPHVTDMNGNVYRVLGDCIPQSQAVAYAAGAASIYGMTLAVTNVGMRGYFPGAVKFTVARDGYSFVPVDIYYMAP